MDTCKEAPSLNFVAGRVCEMRLLFNGDVEIRVSGNDHGKPIRVSQTDQLLRKITFRARVLVVYEKAPKTEKVKLVEVVVNPTTTDILTR